MYFSYFSFLIFLIVAAVIFVSALNQTMSKSEQKFYDTTCTLMRQFSQDWDHDSNCYSLEHKYTRMLIFYGFLFAKVQQRGGTFKEMPLSLCCKFKINRLVREIIRKKNKEEDQKRKNRIHTDLMHATSSLSEYDEAGRIAHHL